LPIAIKEAKKLTLELTKEAGKFKCAEKGGQAPSKMEQQTFRKLQREAKMQRMEKTHFVKMKRLQVQ